MSKEPDSADKDELNDEALDAVAGGLGEIREALPGKRLAEDTITGTSTGVWEDLVFDPGADQAPTISEALDKLLGGDD